MEFFNKIGKKALGSRLRMLTEKITSDASSLYTLYGIDLQPKWFPVFYVLSAGEQKTVTAIAQEIGHSHPSVSKIVGEMSKAGLLVEQKGEADGRKNLVRLSGEGLDINAKIQDQYTDVSNAIEEISAQAKHDLWKAVEEWEYLLEQKSLLGRVVEQRKLRESQHVKIVDYQPQHKHAFKALNEEWISAYFKMEEADYKALDNPEKILDNGGSILVALYNNEVVGVCALMKMNDPDYDFEMAKMAVSPKAQGKNIGWLLGNAVIEKMRSLGGKKLYLESNTILKPAINLYHKLGFKKAPVRITPYERSNIQMELVLKD